MVRCNVFLCIEFSLLWDLMAVYVSTDLYYFDMSPAAQYSTPCARRLEYSVRVLTIILNRISDETGSNKSATDFRYSPSALNMILVSCSFLTFLSQPAFWQFDQTNNCVFSVKAYEPIRLNSLLFHYSKTLRITNFLYVRVA
jgi:hypothetical protein